MLKRKKTYLIPILGIALIIWIGGILLHLPICNTGKMKFIDTLFTSVSSVTTTGYGIGEISSQYTTFAQILIAILMNIGAVGFIALITILWKLQNKKISLSNMKVVNDIIGDNNYFNLKEEIQNILKYVIVIELIGSIFLAFKFIPEYGFLKGSWYSVFHSISAFTNTGFDLFDNTSFCKYSNDIYVQTVIVVLMIIGGIGVLPINDIINNKSRRFSRLKLQSKIVLIYSLALIIISMLGIKLFESNISWMNALFMGATTRNTGLYTISVATMSVPSKLFILLLMLIGGAPGSTAGGIKVVVFAVLEAVAINTLKGKKDVVIFWRKINDNTIKMSITILVIFVVIIVTATIVMLLFNNFGLFNIIFSCVSGISTTGLATVNYKLLNSIGKIVIMLLMFIGRIGPLSVLLLFVPKEDKEDLEYPEEELIL